MTLASNVTRIAPAKPKAVKQKSALAVLQDSFGDLPQLVARRNSGYVVSGVRSMCELSAHVPGHRERALERLKRIPCRGAIEGQREALRVAVYEPASEIETRAILGLMLEGIPAAASGATAGYGDWLAHSIIHADDERDPDEFPLYRGFSAAVLFATAQRVVKSSTFTPSIAEVLGPAQKVRAEYFAALSTTIRLRDLRLNAEEVAGYLEPEDAADSEPAPEAEPAVARDGTEDDDSDIPY